MSANDNQPADGPAQDSPQEPQIPELCSICHEPLTNAIRLECTHVFCYLCIKSSVESSSNCPMCRAVIGIEFEVGDHNIEGPVKIPTSSDESPDGFYWFYEGFRGWWMFDADTSRELEDLYGTQASSKILEKFIAGHVYTIDLASMTQRRKEDGGRVRQVLRSKLGSINVLGLAGIKGQNILDILKSY